MQQVPPKYPDGETWSQMQGQKWDKWHLQFPTLERP